MRARAVIFGVISILALARPAAAQFSSTMGSTMTSAGSSSGNGSTTSSFFSNLLGNRTSVPSYNILNNFPAAPKTYGTMMGRTPTGTTPQAIIVMPQQMTRGYSGSSGGFSGFFRKKQSN